MRRERLRDEQARRIREEHAWRIREPKQNRKDQIRSLQAEAAKRAAEGLAAVAGPTWGADPATIAASAANRTSPGPRKSASALTARHRPAASR
jgi:hypothetical protein